MNNHHRDLAVLPLSPSTASATSETPIESLHDATSIQVSALQQLQVGSEGKSPRKTVSKPPSKAKTARKDITEFFVEPRGNSIPAHDHMADINTLPTPASTAPTNQVQARTEKKAKNGGRGGRKIKDNRVQQKARESSRQAEGEGRPTRSSRTPEFIGDSAKSTPSVVTVASADTVDPFVENRERTARFLLDLFEKYSHGHGGCGTDAHNVQHQTHLEDCDDDNHHPLSATYELGVPYVRDSRCSPLKVGLDTDTFPKPQGHARRMFLKTANLKAVFEGSVDRENEPIRNICLHEEPRTEPQISVSWDTDSILAFLSSLQAFKVPICISFVRQVQFNITSDLHVSKKIAYLDTAGEWRQATVQLQDIPHLYLGYVEGIFPSSVYIFFPAKYDKKTDLMSNKNTTTNYLTAEFANDFFKMILWPACQKYLPDGIVQHFPPGPEVADLKARAKSREHQSEKYSARLRQIMMYSIEPDLLGSIWAEMKRRMGRLAQYQGVFLFLNAKNLKVNHRTEESLFHGLSLSQELIERTLDLRFSEVVVDIGLEVCPVQPRTPTGEPDRREEEDVGGDNAMTLLWRTCCLEQELADIRQAAFPQMLGHPQFYSHGFLRDVSDMTITPPKTSWVGKGGWYYAQWYSSSKEIFDAQKVYPFDNEYLWKLALDEAISRTSDLAQSRFALERSYKESKKRVSRSIPSYTTTSFGQRFEVRMSYSTMLSMKDQISDQEPSIFAIEDIPETSWSLQTASYCAFYRGNYDKFSSLLECVILSAPATGITQERAQLLYAVIHCLQAFQNVQLRANGLLWVGERDVDGQLDRGLDFQHTVRDYGYGWWGPIFDWTAWTFRQDIEGQLVGTKRLLRGCYIDASRLASDTYSLITLSVAQLRQTSIPSAACDRILSALAHFVLREYRRDILDLLGKRYGRGELRDDVDNDEGKDTARFCIKGITQILVGAPWLVVGNRSKIKFPDQLFEWIMGDKPGHNRKHFEGKVGRAKSYRVMLGKINEEMKLQPKLPELWQSRLFQEFFTYHTLIPYPDTNGTLISVKDVGGARSFWPAAPGDRPGEFKWAQSERDQVQGFPPTYPETLRMDAAGLQAYFTRG